MKRIATVLGARPQFIKAAPVCTALREAGLEEILVHTGQHYDPGMSEVFFSELSLPKPKWNLKVGSGSQGRQTGEMLIRVEEVLLAEKPDLVLLYGDTNSTLAGAIAACKLRIPIVHVEAGLRSFNRAMPEEHNRVLTDHCSQVLFCPTETSMRNLRTEGIVQGVHLVGDTMLDTVRAFLPKAQRMSRVLEELRLQEKKYYLATVHRPVNADDKSALENLFRSFAALPHPVVFPVHPRTRAKIKEFGLITPENIRMTDPYGYLDMLRLQAGALAIITDSGGVQKEAFFLRVPCVTLRAETEWVETVQAGWNFLVGSGPERIVKTVRELEGRVFPDPPDCFGDGRAAVQIARILRSR